MPAQKEISRPGALSFFSKSIPFLVLGLFCVVGMLGYVYFDRQTTTIAQTRLDHEVDDRVGLIREKIGSDIAVIRGIQGLYNASDVVNRDEFTTYLHTLQLEKNYPGIYSIVYGKKVEQEQRAQFETTVQHDTSLRSDGYPAFAIYPKEATGSSYIITYIYPETTFFTDLGYVISSDELKARVIQEAVRIQGLAISEVVSLPNSEIKVVLLVIPVGTGTASEGVILLRVNIDQFFLPLRAGIDKRDRFYYRIIDQHAASEHALIVDTVPSGYKKDIGLQRVQQLTFGTTMWDVEVYTSKTHGLTVIERMTPLVIAEITIAIGIFMFLLLYQTMRTKNLAVRMADAMVVDLKESELRAILEKTKFEALLNSIGDGMIATDDQLKIVVMNPAAETLLGWKKEEVFGKILTDVVPVVDDAGKSIVETERPIVKAMTELKAFVTTINSNYNYVTKDGKKFPVLLNAAPVVSMGKLLGGINIFRDISHEKDVDRMKTEFISLASHQLRTPLSAMKWFSEMLLAGDAGVLTPEQKEYIGNIDQSNERMIALVNSLLNISRIESGRIMINPEPTDVGALVTGVIKELQMKLDEKKMTIVTSIHADLGKIMLDPQLIREVYKNLLTNSIKYTPAGGEITVFVSKKGEEILSQVTDTGYGIPEKDKPRIFDKLYRGENIVKLETDGTGLGLYLVKAIIDSSGGKVWFESVENKGTTFWFSLPASGMKKKEGEVTINA